MSNTPFASSLARNVQSVPEMNAGVANPNYGITSVITGMAAASIVDTAYPATARPVPNEFEDINQQFAALHDQFDQLAASIANTRPMAYNSRLFYSGFKLLKQTVPGHGLALAQAAAQGLDPAVQQGIIIPPNPPAVGATPPPLPKSTLEYSNADILRMIIFYNKDFGVVPGDTLEVRTSKFCSYLSGR